MLTDPTNLLVVANSARGIAASAVRGGFNVSVCDGFCDQDTRELAGHCCRISMDRFGLSEDRLAAELLNLNRAGGEVGLIYGAGLENHRDTLSGFSRRYLLLGNSVASVERVSDPRQFFALLDDLEIPAPETRFRLPLDTATRWLQKRPGSGGQGVRFLRSSHAQTDAGTYYQRYLPGAVLSVLFIANGIDHQVIGYNKLKQAAGGNARPFLYAGAVGMVRLTSAVTVPLRSFVGKLVAELELRGINSLDFVLWNDRIFVLELNPRPSATLELYEHLVSGGWIRQHVRACLGELPEPSMVARSHLLHGQLIVYLHAAVSIPRSIDWPAWARDRPPPGSLLAKGDALCSLYAGGRTVEAVELQLQQRRRAILESIGCPEEVNDAGN